jgi:hypothetical protein
MTGSTRSASLRPFGLVAAIALMLAAPSASAEPDPAPAHADRHEAKAQTSDGAATGDQPGSDEAERLFREGVAAYEDGRPADAEELCARAARDP